MTEKQVMKCYQKALAFVVELMGTDGITSNLQLNKAGTALFGHHYAGTFPPADLPPPAPHQITIINTKNGQGEHWLLRFCNESHGIWYDSFGRDVKRLINTKYIHENTDNDPEQAISESNCGQRCLAAAICGRFLGIQALKKI